MIKDILRPCWRSLYRHYKILDSKMRSFDLPLDKILSGGSNGIRAAKYAEITNDFLLPSRPATLSPHVMLLEEYDRLGNDVLSDENFEKTPYYKAFAKCIDLTGSDFYDDKAKIIDVARTFINQYKGIYLSNTVHPGQSSLGAPVWVRPIRNSTCYELIDGHHRVALAFKRGQKTIKAITFYKEPVFTPLQQLLLDVLWINKEKWLYQPIHSPELADEWVLVRDCEDRLNYMVNFLQSQKLPLKTLTYLDVGSSYGWFVHKMSYLGLDAFGVERDCIAIEVGERVYNLPRTKVENMEIGHYVKNTQESYDVVSCMSVLHHFVLNKNSTTAVELIRNLDRITNKVLFIDTAQNHEKSFAPLLPEWDDEYIVNWIKGNTSFQNVRALGRDNDCKTPFENYYNRTFFVCTRS